jgi:hypothetical protein
MADVVVESGRSPCPCRHAHQSPMLAWPEPSVCSVGGVVGSVGIGAQRLSPVGCLLRLPLAIGAGAGPVRSFRVKRNPTPTTGVPFV